MQTESHIWSREDAARLVGDIRKGYPDIQDRAVFLLGTLIADLQAMGLVSPGAINEALRDGTRKILTALAKRPSLKV